MSGQQQPRRVSSYQGYVTYVPMMVPQCGPVPSRRGFPDPRRGFPDPRRGFVPDPRHGFVPVPPPQRNFVPDPRRGFVPDSKSVSCAPKTDGPVRTKRPHAELTFAGLTNGIKGLVIGHGGAIQKLLTGHAEKKLAFRLRYYKIEDDVDSYFKIVVGGEPQDVLLAQEFVFKLISTSHRRAASNKGLEIDGVYSWKYIPGDHCFVIQYDGNEWHQALPAVTDDEDEEFQRPVSPSYKPPENRSSTPTTPP